MKYPIVQCSSWCSAVQFIVLQWSIVQWSIVQWSIVQCSTVDFGGVQCSAVQCRTIYTARVLSLQGSAVVSPNMLRFTGLDKSKLAPKDASLEP